MTTQSDNPRLRELSRKAKSALARHGPSDVLVFMHESLSQGRVASINGGIEEILLENGRFFARSALPASVRRGRMRHCFENAFYAAERGDGVYVEGFALQGERLVHHAWITTGDSQAIEVTWKENTSASYFGISFDDKLRRLFVNKTETPGILFDEETLPLNEVACYLNGRPVDPWPAGRPAI